MNFLARLKTFLTISDTEVAFSLQGKEEKFESSYLTELHPASSAVDQSSGYYKFRDMWDPEFIEWFVGYVEGEGCFL